MTHFKKLLSGVFILVGLVCSPLNARWTFHLKEKDRDFGILKINTRTYAIGLDEGSVFYGVENGDFIIENKDQSGSCEYRQATDEEVRAILNFKLTYHRNVAFVNEDDVPRAQNWVIPVADDEWKAEPHQEKPCFYSFRAQTEEGVSYQLHYDFNHTNGGRVWRHGQAFFMDREGRFWFLVGKNSDNTVLLLSPNPRQTEVLENFYKEFYKKHPDFVSHREIPISLPVRKISWNEAIEYFNTHKSICSLGAYCRSLSAKNAKKTVEDEKEVGFYFDSFSAKPQTGVVIAANQEQFSYLTCSGKRLNLDDRKKCFWNEENNGTRFLLVDSRGDYWIQLPKDERNAYKRPGDNSIYIRRPTIEESEIINKYLLHFKECDLAVQNIPLDREKTKNIRKIE